MLSSYWILHQILQCMRILKAWFPCMLSEDGDTSLDATELGCSEVELLPWIRGADGDSTSTNWFGRSPTNFALSKLSVEDYDSPGQGPIEVRWNSEDFKSWLAFLILDAWKLYIWWSHNASLFVKQWMSSSLTCFSKRRWYPYVSLNVSYGKVSL